MNSKYEQIMEYVTNGETDKAKALFHEIVVEQSRAIYESLVDEEDFTETVSNDKSKKFIKDVKKDVDTEEEGVAEGLAGIITNEEAKQLMDWIDTGVNEGVNPELIQKISEFYGVSPEQGLKEALEENSGQLLDVAYGTVNELDDEMPADDGMGMDDEMGAGDDMSMGAGDDMGMDDEMGAGDDMSMGAGDDMGMDDEMGAGDDMGMGDEGGLEDRVVDLEDALDELKAEFDSLMASSDVDGDGDHDMNDHALGGDDMGAGDDMGGDAEGGNFAADAEMDGEVTAASDDDEQPTESRAPKSASELMREYVEKVSDEGQKSETGKLAGANTGTKDSVSVNKTSPGNDGKGRIASPANSKNLGRQDTGRQNQDGTSPKSASNYGTKGEGKLPGADKFENVPGAKAGKTWGNAKKPVSSEQNSPNKTSPVGSK